MSGRSCFHTDGQRKPSVVGCVVGTAVGAGDIEGCGDGAMTGDAETDGAVDMLGA